MATPLMAVTAFSAPFNSGASSTMTVPGWVGLKVFLMRRGMPLSTQGRIVLGCSTLAP